MTTYRIIPATAEHALAVAKAMRQADQDEVWASSRETPRQAVLNSLVVSNLAWAALADDEVLGLFGVGAQSFVDDVGVPWMLTTEALPKHARKFLRHSRDVVQYMRSTFPRLTNVVDARNTEAIKWLRWLGFEIHPAFPFGPDQLPFHPFVMEQAYV